MLRDVGAPEARIGLDRLYAAAAQRVVVVPRNCRYTPHTPAAVYDRKPGRNGGGGVR